MTNLENSVDMRARTLGCALLFGSRAMVSVAYMDSSNGACPEGGVARADFELVEIKKTEGLAS